MLQHGTGLPIAEHYTNIGGATDQVFGLLTLLGFRFAPRLRDLKDRMPTGTDECCGVEVAV